MIRHKNMVHSDEARKFKCPYDNCLSNGFIDNYHLKRHIKSVHEEEYVCTICFEKSQSHEGNTPNIKYRFKKKKQLAKHKLDVHENKNKFTCKLCSKNFTNQKQFDAHMSRHEDKIQKKNKQIVDLVDANKEEAKEIDFEDHELKLNILKSQSDSSPFQLDYDKRLSRIQSHERKLDYESGDNKASLIKVGINHR